MNSIRPCHCGQIVGIAIVLSAIAFTGLSLERHTSAQTQAPLVEPDEATKARLQGIVNGVLAIWDKFDVVCLGESHGSKNDSDLRIALIEHPAFIRKVKVIIVEFADSVHQDILDQLALEGEDILVKNYGRSGRIPAGRQCGNYQSTMHSCGLCGRSISPYPGANASA